MRVNSSVSALSCEMLLEEALLLSGAIAVGIEWSAVSRDKVSAILSEPTMRLVCQLLREGEYGETGIDFSPRSCEQTGILVPGFAVCVSRTPTVVTMTMPCESARTLSRVISYGLRCTENSASFFRHCGVSALCAETIAAALATCENSTVVVPIARGVSLVEDPPFPLLFQKCDLLESRVTSLRWLTAFEAAFNSGQIDYQYFLYLVEYMILEVREAEGDVIAPTLRDHWISASREPESWRSHLAEILTILESVSWIQGWRGRDENH